jgi:hypothetical protein
MKDDGQTRQMNMLWDKRSSEVLVENSEQRTGVGGYLYPYGIGKFNLKIPSPSGRLSHR